MADTAIYTAEKTLRDLGDKVPSESKADIESKVGSLQTTLQGKDINDIRRKTDELVQAIQKVGAASYEQEAGPTPPPPGGDAEAGPDDDTTVEGEFREV
jgi:molecular chaperone DnaK